MYSWRFYGSSDWVSYKVNAYNKEAAFDTLIRIAQENHMIQISEPKEMAPCTNKSSR